MKLRLPLLLIGFFLVLVGIPSPIGAQDLVPEAPSAVLMDQVSGRVLFQKHSDLAIPPASLTKLMTLHLAWKALSEGRIHPSDLVPITPATTGSSVPKGSSLMFLEPGQQVSIRDLMLGLAVDSGNDAGMTLAQYLAGSQEAFVAQMNQESHALGLSATVFYDAFGFDARNRTTAADFARFCRIYLAAHPQSVQVLHSVRQMAFPKPENLAPGDHHTARTIVQTNRNSLLDAYPGADGLKTGYIEESGYNLAATALRGEQRLVAVILGIQGRDTAQGTRIRTAAAARLLDFGFQNYPLRALPLPERPTVRTWYSEPGNITPLLEGSTVFPLSESETQGLSVITEIPTEVRGPLTSGTVVGYAVWKRDGREFYRLPYKTASNVPLAPWWTGFWDRIVLTLRGLTGTPAPRPIASHTES